MIDINKDVKTIKYNNTTLGIRELNKVVEFSCNDEIVTKMTIKNGMSVNKIPPYEGYSDFADEDGNLIIFPFTPTENRTTLYGINWRDHYQEVEYLESSGTQYIDTGFAFDTAAKCSNFEIELKVAYSSDPDIFLGAFNSNTQCFKFDISGSTKTTMFIPAGDGAETAHSITGLTNDGTTWNAIKVNRTNNTFTKYLNNELKGTETVTSTSPFDKSLYLFACNGEAGTYEEGRVAYCKITAGGTVVREFVPCYRKIDSVAGMYDLATRQFFTNIGTGSFTPGPDVN